MQLAMGGALTLGLPAGPPAARASTGGSVPPTSFYANFQGMRLLDHDGKPWSPTALQGRLALVNFVFTGCSTACPVQTRGLVELQRQLPPAMRDRVRLVSLSLDPLNDTPQALKAFAQRMGANLSGWSFVTGRPTDIERLSDTLRLFRPGPDVKKPDDHSTALWLLDIQGQLRMRYAGNPPDVSRLLRELPELWALQSPAHTNNQRT